jgi:hypothetical protein
MSDVITWLHRIVTFLPELMGLYEAVSRNDETAKLNAQLALVRAMKDEQARRDIGGV